MEKEIFIKGRKLVYYEEGEGYPFLILHGWGSLSTRPYVKFRELLVSHGYKVIFFNLPGFEGSISPSSRWGMDEYLNYILDFIDQLNLEKLFLFGHSFGGAMAVRLAVTHPERIKALILLSTGVFLPAGSSVWGYRIFTAGFYGFLIVVKIGEIFITFCLTILKNLILFCSKVVRPKKARNWLEGKLKKLFQKVEGWWDKLGPIHQFFFEKEKLMSRILRNIVGVENTIPYLQKIPHPVLTIWGGWKDFNFYLGASQMGHIPNYTFKIVPEAGHHLQEEAPEKLIGLIVDFIKKLEEEG